MDAVKTRAKAAKHNGWIHILGNCFVHENFLLSTDREKSSRTTTTKLWMCVGNLTLSYSSFGMELTAEIRFNHSMENKYDLLLLIKRFLFLCWYLRPIHDAFEVKKTFFSFSVCSARWTDNGVKDGFIKNSREFFDVCPSFFFFSPPVGVTEIPRDLHAILCSFPSQLSIHFQFHI